MLVRNERARRGYSDVDHVDAGAGVGWLIAHLFIGTCARIQPLYPPVRVRFRMAMFVLTCWLVSVRVQVADMVCL